MPTLASPRRFVLTALLAATLSAVPAFAATVTENPFLGITHITRTESTPRAVTMHVVLIDLTAPGVSFKLSPQEGTAEGFRKTVRDYVDLQDAKVGINVHFFDPVSNAQPNVRLAGLAASSGSVYSGFEGPFTTTTGLVQNYAIVPFAAALNLSATNVPSIVHHDPAFPDGTRTLENVQPYNALSGSAQIITNGVKSVPTYFDAATNPTGLLTNGNGWSNANSWYNALNARSSAGFTQDGKTLVLFTVDRAAGSQGMTVGEVADVLLNDYGVYNALNLDGGGSTTLALENPAGAVVVANNSADAAGLKVGRAVGSVLAVYANPVPEPAALSLLLPLAPLLRRRR